MPIYRIFVDPESTAFHAALEKVPEHHRKEVKTKVALLMLCDPGTEIPGVGYKYSTWSGRWLRVKIPE